MRTETPTVLPLFRSELQLRLLGLILLAPEQWWTTEELRGRLGAPAATIHRELHRALDAALVEREAIGRTFRYRAATRSPLYEPLRELLERTVGLETGLRQVLADAPGVEAAAIYGSYARGSRVRPTSDVDVIVLGTTDLRDLRRRLRPLERQTGREIDVALFGADEFRRLLKRRSSFARDVAENPLTPIVGEVKAFRGE